MMTTSDREDRRELVSAADAALMLGVSRRSWWRYVSTGKAPPAIRIGGAVRWRRSELAQWIEAGCPSCRRNVTD